MASRAPAREQTRARYPDATGFVERDGVRVVLGALRRGRPDDPAHPTGRSSTRATGSSRSRSSPPPPGGDVRRPRQRPLVDDPTRSGALQPTRSSRPTGSRPRRGRRGARRRRRPVDGRRLRPSPRRGPPGPRPRPVLFGPRWICDRTGPRADDDPSRDAADRGRRLGQVQRPLLAPRLAGLRSRSSSARSSHEPHSTKPIEDMRRLGARDRPRDDPATDRAPPLPASDGRPHAMLLDAHPLRRPS